MPGNDKLSLTVIYFRLCMGTRPSYSMKRLGLVSKRQHCPKIENGHKESHEGGTSIIFLSACKLSCILIPSRLAVFSIKFPEEISL